MYPLVIPSKITLANLLKINSLNSHTTSDGLIPVNLISRSSPENIPKTGEFVKNIPIHMNIMNVFQYLINLIGLIIQKISISGHKRYMMI